MSFWKKRLPKREDILKSRLIRPFAHHLGHGALWHLNRRSVAKGVAIGMFFAFLTPVAQTVFAAAASIPFRANVAVAALSTFITNPITTPPLLYFAHAAGQWLLNDLGLPVEHHDVFVSVQGLLSDAPAVLGATALGLLIFAVISAILGYVAVDMLWRWRLIQRWRARKA